MPPQAAYSLHFSAKGCLIKGFNQNEEDLTISLHQDCNDLNHPVWSYSALNFGKFSRLNTVQFLSLITIPIFQFPKNLYLIIWKLGQNPFLDLHEFIVKDLRKLLSRDHSYLVRQTIAIIFLIISQGYCFSFKSSIKDNATNLQIQNLNTELNDRSDLRNCLDNSTTNICIYPEILIFLDDKIQEKIRTKNNSETSQQYVNHFIEKLKQKFDKLLDPRNVWNLVGWS